MIKVENLSYSYPQKDLYHKISFTIEDNRHCALIGSSGTGKSTLIDVLMNPEKHLYDGKVTVPEELRIGYVSQFTTLDVSSDLTVFDYIAEEFVRLQNDMNELCLQMETATDLEPILEQYQNALDHFDLIGGNEYESNITKKLSIANLSRLEHQPVASLSGGEFKLIQIIKEMMIAPGLLIMDEPDVFLDFSRLNSLMDLINTHQGSMLVITHNRYLLNHCFDKILHLENAQLQEFDGNYTDYHFSLLQKKIELQEMSAADQAEIERNLQIIDKMRADATYYTCASRGRTLNARVSLLQRLEARKTKEPFVDIFKPQIIFQTEPLEPETTVLKVEDYSVGFDTTLLEHVSFEVKANEKVALIGPNGTGKTTLLRDIYKNQKKAIQLDDSASMAFLSQLQGEMLNESNTILDEFLEAGFTTRDEAELYLTTFGFDETMLNQKIGLLSGGEKNLIQLAKLSAGNANLLLLDEPTSHLDTNSQEALEQAIIDFNGAVFMISHDYYLIANCVDYVLLIEDKGIRKISARKFRKMIYANHFDKDYLETEEKRKTLETRILHALNEKDYVLARELSEKLEILLPSR